MTLILTSVIYYHIVSPHKAAFGISNIRQALIERTQTTLRHVVGARVLQDVIERREEVAQSIGEIIEDVAAGCGCPRRSGPHAPGGPLASVRHIRRQGTRGSGGRRWHLRPLLLPPF